MGRRTLLLLTSLLIAALGTALVAIYVRGADDRAFASVDSVEVLVATADMQAGTLVDEVIPKSQQEPVLDRETVQQQAVRSHAALGQLGDKVLKAPVYAGQVIDQRMFQDAGDASAQATSAVTKGNVAISVQMADAERVAAFIRPQSSIIVYFTRQGATPGASRTEVLLKQAKVLAVGNPVANDSSASARTGAGAQDESLPTTIVTLDVSPKDSQRLTYARTAGVLSLALRNDDSAVDDTIVVNDGNVTKP